MIGMTKTRRDILTAMIGTIEFTKMWIGRGEREATTKSRNQIIASIENSKDEMMISERELAGEVMMINAARGAVPTREGIGSALPRVEREIGRGHPMIEIRRKGVVRKIGM